MDKKKRFKRIFSILFVTIGAIALIIEIGGTEKNYYVQCLGIIFLMVGLFLVNTTIVSKELKKEMNPEEDIE